MEEIKSNIIIQCQVPNCTAKIYGYNYKFHWAILFGVKIFPKFWKGLVKTKYCPHHGNYMEIDGIWWWYSYFRPLLPLYNSAIAKCPQNCLGEDWNFKNIHKGKDGLYYCDHCDWKGKSIDHDL